MSTGEEIRKARRKAGLSQRALADKLGVSASMIGQYENEMRSPKFETADRIADALGVSVFDLIGYDNEEWRTVEWLCSEEIRIRYELYDAIGRLSFDAVRCVWRWLESFIRKNPEEIITKPIGLNTLFPLEDERKKMEKDEPESPD